MPEALTEVVRSGKVRYLGFSEWPADRIQAAIDMVGVEKFVSSQPQYSLLHRDPEAKVIPLSATLTLLDWIEDSQAHIFGRCGHWTQIEHTEAFSKLVVDFLA